MNKTILLLKNEWAGLSEKPPFDEWIWINADKLGRLIIDNYDKNKRNISRNARRRNAK